MNRTLRTGTFQTRVLGGIRAGHPCADLSEESLNVCAKDESWGNITWTEQGPLGTSLFPWPVMR